MQQQHIASGLVPLLSTQAGSCLTLANLEDTGVTTVSINLVDFLMKPGLAVLNQLTSIRSYYKWSYRIILNAILPPADREDRYRFRSIYDGGLIEIDARSLFALIGNLKPDAVIFSKESAAYFRDFSSLLAGDTEVCFHYGENLPDTDSKVSRYRMFDAQHSFSGFLDELEDCNDIVYLTGNFDFYQLQKLAAYRKYLIESDMPARDGMNGIVYSQEGPLHILDTSMTNDSRLIDKACQCQTCRQMFTRAYLHHLLQQTPLLAQRYLIQHNLWYCQNHL